MRRCFRFSTGNRGWNSRGGHGFHGSPEVPLGKLAYSSPINLFVSRDELPGSSCPLWLTGLSIQADGSSGGAISRVTIRLSFRLFGTRVSA